MYNNSIITSKSGITGIADRPNIIITDTRNTVSSVTEKLQGMLLREEINICTARSADELIKGSPESWHMLLICDGGLEQPSFELIEKVRKFSDIPMLTISENSSEIYRIMALSKGADFCMEYDGLGSFELKARIVSVLRRYLSESGSDEMKPIGDTITNGSLTVDRRRREVFCGENRIRLTAIEYGIIEYLMENCGDVCTVEDIYRRVWRETPYSVRKTVVEHIRRIRSKIEPDPHNPSYIKAVFGKGYKMERAS